MRIIYIITKFSPTIGGGESHIELVARGMVGLGHDVTIITSTNNRRKMALYPFSIIEINNLYDDKISLSASYELCQTLQSIRADIIHLVNYEILFYFELIQLGLQKIPCIFSTYNTPVKNQRIFGSTTTYGFERHNIQRLLRALNITKFIANSQVFLEGLNEVGIPRKSIEFIPFGIDLGLFSENTSTKQTKFVDVLCTSRFVKRKGIDVLISTLKYLPLEYRIHLTGYSTVFEPKTHEYLTNLANNYRGRAILYKKRKDIFSLVRLYNSADIFVMPSEFEGFGLAALEAMACGTPVVATRVQGLQEFIVDGNNGLFVDYGNPKQIAQAILEIQNNKNLKEKLRSNSRLIVKRDHDANSMVNLYEQTYKKAVSK
ncbi:MAG TPA: glycosyltransferase family 4 protein [Candidatus Saccharimonas sp.]|nr:glycosyltransferase family 4 protein [Candidatus Saccharimonas sp.]